ncbi:MAG TPA: hypothetical protein VLX85_01370 [Stellaceae bacterium]|nr:hypothetical protein [Stellaceae bacterium]
MPRPRRRTLDRHLGTRLTSFAHLLSARLGEFFTAGPRPARRRSFRRYRRTLRLVRAYCRIPPARRREMMTLIQDAAEQGTTFNENET